MRIGLLLCDHLDTPVADEVGDYPALFDAAFGASSPNRDTVSLCVYDAVSGELPESLDECDGWIVSGSRSSVYDDEEWIRRLESLVGELIEDGRPLAGICFGHQLTAQALGGTVRKADAGWGVGARRFDVVAPAPWMDGASEFTLIMSHQDQVTELPDGAVVVATADYCPVGAYRIGDSVFCVQGHPEWVPALSRRLMRARRERIGDEQVDAGLKSLEQPLDQQRVANWIVAFLGSAQS